MLNRRFSVGLVLLASGLIFVVGCGGPPSLYDITGKVTLGGKSYARLLVYFRPVSGEHTAYNVGVGETDEEGNLQGVRSSGGHGLQTGEYRVTFVCKVPKKPNPNIKLTSDDKPDEMGVTVVEMVPDAYSDSKAAQTSEVRFTVSSGTNTFTYDIPAK